MPTKKRTKKMPPKRKATAKGGKLRNFFSKLNPNSPKKKLLLFVVVFGLIAGGFYAYRSFAYYGSRSPRVGRVLHVSQLQKSGGYYTTMSNPTPGPFKGWRIQGLKVGDPRGAQWARLTFTSWGGAEYCFWGVAGNAYMEFEFANGGIIQREASHLTGPTRERSLRCFIAPKGGTTSLTVTVPHGHSVLLTNMTVK